MMFSEMISLLTGRARNRTKQDSIDHLDQLSRQLRTFVAPLRTFLEDALYLGNAQIVRKAAYRLDPHRFGRMEENDMKDNISLLDKITLGLVNSQFDTGAVRKFAPNGLIRGLIVPDDVRATLAEGLPSGQKEVDQDLVDYIVFRARNLFAICLKQYLEDSSLLKAMVLFKENSISDADLPLEQKETRPPPTEDTNFSSTSTREFVPKLLEIDPNQEIWKYSRRQPFIETEQWAFLAPVFSTKDDNQDLKQSCVLPFRTRGKENAGGGFGIVSRIEIQEGHIKDPDNLVRTLKCPGYPTPLSSG